MINFTEKKQAEGTGQAQRERKLFKFSRPERVASAKPKLRELQFKSLLPTDKPEFIINGKTHLDTDGKILQKKQSHGVNMGNMRPKKALCTQRHATQAASGHQTKRGHLVFIQEAKGSTERK